MKTPLLFLLLLVGNHLFAAEETDRIGLYFWKHARTMKSCHINGDLDDGSQASEPGQKFQVIEIIKDSAIIKILDYTKKKDDKTLELSPKFFVYNYKADRTVYTNSATENRMARAYGANQLYFKIPVIDLDKYAVREEIIKASLAAGIINFPFKYRPQKDNKDFTGSFNFGAGVGYTFSHKSWRTFTHSVLSGYSISNIVLDAASVTKNAEKLESTNNFTAFSFSLGYMVQYDKVQAGIFLGWDNISKITHNEFNWVYQGKPWISVGFGLAIFSGEKVKAGTDIEQPENLQ
ncbi:MAG: hypothetical protein V4717_14970 [Bacteroidota bacterium]